MLAMCITKLALLLAATAGVKHAWACGARLVCMQHTAAGVTELDVLQT